MVCCRGQDAADSVGLLDCCHRSPKCQESAERGECKSEKTLIQVTSTAFHIGFISLEGILGLCTAITTPGKEY